jgi:hypothetical protein
MPFTGSMRNAEFSYRTSQIFGSNQHRREDKNVKILLRATVYTRPYAVNDAAQYTM